MIMFFFGQKIFKSLFLILIFFFIINLKTKYLKGQEYLLYEKNSNNLDNIKTKILSTESIEDFNIPQSELLSNIEDFIKIPEGGTPWNVFGEAGMNEYTFTDNENNDWAGVRPEFTDQLKKLDSEEILIQGYMFPLEQTEEQSLFLLGPFPVTCPYHFHVSANLIIEVHAEKPILYSYEPVNIRGKLELVPKDDEYNIFYRLKNAKIISE